MYFRQLGFGHRTANTMIRTSRGLMTMAILSRGRAVCIKAGFLLMLFEQQKQTGRALGNDTLIRTGSNPDTFRGADVCFISYDRLPKDQPTPKGPLEVAPDL
jgi:hypothetical protein